MSTKPTELIGWTASGGTITEPSITDKTNGFSPAMKPPSAWFNYFWKYVSDWVQYLNDVLPDGEVSIGEDLVGTAANSRLPRVSFPVAGHATSTRTCLFRFGVAGGLVKSAALYSYTSDSIGYLLEIVANAEWDGTNWSRITGTHDAAILRVGFDGTFMVAWRDDAASDTWADSYAGTAGGGTGWTFIISAGTSGMSTTDLGCAGLVVTGSALVGGAVITDNITSANLTTSADLTVGDDLIVNDAATITGNLTVNGNTVLGNAVTDTVTVAGDLTVGDDLTVTDDLIVSSSATVTQDLSVGLNLTAGTGIYTLEPIFGWSAYTTGTVNGRLFTAISSSTSSRFWRHRAGKLNRAQIWVNTNVAENLTITIKGNITGTLGSITLTAGEMSGGTLHKTAQFSSNYVIGEYIYVELAAGGTGTVSAVDVGVSLELVG